MNNNKKLILYEVNAKYFKDTSGNGIGDLKGLSDKFEYFEHLNVDAIILQDALASDGTGKIRSFTQLDKNIGTINDLIKVISYARKAKIRVILELNIGTITEEHNWFISSSDRDIQEFRDVVQYRPAMDDKTLEFKYSKSRQEYYIEDSETREIPLNWNSENVLDKFMEVIRFWTGLGITGFAFKKFEYLQDLSKTNIMNEATLKELRKLYNRIKEHNDNIMIIAKSFDIKVAESQRFVDGPTKVFDYFLSTRISNLGVSHKYGQNAPGKFAPKMLLAPLRAYIKSNSSIVSLNSPHVGKVLSRWMNDQQYVNEAAKSLGMLMFLHTGSVSIYAGDEIGATNIGLTHLDDFQTPNIDARLHIALQSRITESEFFDAQVKLNPINARTLMAWNDKKNGGFSTADRTVTPVSFSYKELNVATEFSDEHSTLNFYRELIRLVKKSSFSTIFNKGEIKITSWIPGVIKYSLRYAHKEIFVYINMSKGTKPILRPKRGRVVLSSYANKIYSEIPKRLLPYESIMVSKVADDHIKMTRQLELTKLKEKERAARERLREKELERLEKLKEAEALERAKEKALQEKLAKAQQEEKEKVIREKQIQDRKQQEIKEKEQKELESQKRKERLAKQEAREAQKTLQLELRNKKREEDKLAREKSFLERQAIHQKEREKREAEKTRQIELRNKQREEARLIKEKEYKERMAQKQKERETRIAEKTQQIELRNKQREEARALREKEIKERQKQREIERKKREDEKTHQIELRHQEREKRQAEKTRLLELKYKEQAEAKVAKEKEKQESEIQALKEAKRLAAIERKADRSHLTEATNLKEDEIAKTTLVDDSIDLDELFEKENVRQSRLKKKNNKDKNKVENKKR